VLETKKTDEIRELETEKMHAHMHVCIYACMHVYVHTYIHTEWGGQSWTKMVGFFFSIYRPSCFIEAYSSAENYCLVCVGQLANHLWGLDLIFLSSSLLAAAE
jgi:hypothetical protein